MMNMSIKEKILIGIIGTILTIAIGGSVWAFTTNGGTEDGKVQGTTSKGEKIDSPVKDKANLSDVKDEPIRDEDSSDSFKAGTAPQSSTSVHSPSSSTRNALQPTKAHTGTSSFSTPSQEHTPPSHSVAVCDEDMKSSYTRLRDSQISAENARWTRQVNGFHEEAARRGGAHSGLAQAMINDALPAHEVNLVNIESQYQLDLHSISC